MKLFFLFLLLISANSVRSQILDNQFGNAFTDVPFFNTSFIKKNKLKMLKGYFVYKKRNSTMEDTDFEFVYNFNTDGQLASTYETRKGDGTDNINWNKYSYNQEGKLVDHKSTDNDGYNGVGYQYDVDGLLVKESFYRDFDTSNLNANPIEFNSESWKYYVDGNFTKRTRHNSYGLPYMDEFIYKNDLGYIVKREELLKMTSTRYIYDYKYNDKGLLSGIVKSQAGTPTPIEEFRFDYDELGNLIEKHLYKDGVFVTDFQIIYNSKTKLLSSIIIRDVATGFLIIIRFKSYEFF